MLVPRSSERPLSRRTTWHAAGPSWSSGAPRAGDERRVGGELLARARARQQPQQRPRVVERRHHLLDGGEHDVHLGQRQRQVGVAFVGDDDGRAGLGDEKVGAGDADVGRKKFLAQHAARLRHEGLGARKIAVGGQVAVVAAEVGGDVVGPRWIAGAIRWLGLSPRIWMMYSPRSVSTTSSAAASSRASSPISSDTIDLLLVTRRAPASRQMPRTMSHASSAVAAQCTCAPARRRVALERLEVEVEMGERVVLDVASDAAQGVELGQRRLGPRARRRKAARHLGERALQRLRRRARPRRWRRTRSPVFMARVRLRAARWAARPSRPPAPRRCGGRRHASPRASSLPARCMRQPSSPDDEQRRRGGGDGRRLARGDGVGDVGVLDREEPAEAAAGLRVGELDELEAVAHAAEQRARLARDAELAQARAAVMAGDAPGEGARHGR